MKIRNMVQIAAALAAAGTVASAHAALVGSWDYSVLTQFSGVNTFGAGGGTQFETPRHVTWGDGPDLDVFVSGSARSGISISDDSANKAGNDPSVDPKTGVVVTNDLSFAGIGKGVWITHHNNVINAASLKTSEISSSLQLWAIPPGNGGGAADVALPTLNFTIYFAETPNVEGTCAAASPPGNPCNDIFALKASQALNQQFTFDGLDYFVSVFPIGGPGLGTFSALSAAECAASGAGPGCFGFTTVEGQDTTIQFGFAITSERVGIPEPEMLGLFGLSLLGLVAARRRRVS